jgi:hypothetical protein
MSRLVLSMTQYRGAFIVARVFRPGGLCVPHRNPPASEEAGYNATDEAIT